MKYKFSILTALAVAASFSLANPAYAQCNPTDKSSKEACFSSCNSCAGPFQGACKAQCASIVSKPPPVKAPPPTPTVTATVDAGPPPPPPPPVDAGPTCRAKEVLLSVPDCVCVVGFGRLEPMGPCVAVCKDGEVRDSAGNCAPPPPCEPKPAPPPPPPPTGGDWWWILLVLLLASLGGNAWQATRKPKNGK